jgi:sugar lactone lactonase YvrE
VPKIGGAGSIAGLAASSTGDVYFTEGFDHRVRKLSNGVVTTAAGNGIAGYSGDDGSAQNAQLNFPLGLAVDAFDNLYIADRNNGVIRKVANGIITTVAGPLSNLNEVAVDGLGNLYVADGWSVYRASNGVITKIADGSARQGDDGSAAPGAQLWQPSALAADAAGCLYVSDSLNNRILVFTPILRGAPLVHRRFLDEDLQTVAPRRAITTGCGKASLE